MWKKIPFNKLFAAAAIVAVLTSVVIILAGNFLPPLVPLFYGRPFGEDRLTGKIGLIIAPLASIAITTLNLFLSIKIKDIYLQRILAISALVISILSAITILKIIFLVGFF